MILVKQETIRGAAAPSDVSGGASTEEPISRSAYRGRPQDAERDSSGRYLPGPRRSVGAPKGNLSAVRNPWNTYWRRRALRHEDRWVLRLVKDYVPELIADKGGESNVSFAETKVMEVAAAARLCWLLCKSKEYLDGVARFQMIEVKCLSDLGLKRRARIIDPLQIARDAVAQANEPLDVVAAVGCKVTPLKGDQAP